MHVLQISRRRLKAVLALGVELGEISGVLGLAVEVAAVVDGRKRPLRLLGEPGALLVGERPQRSECGFDAALHVLWLDELRQAGLFEWLHWSPLLIRRSASSTGIILTAIRREEF